MITTQFLPRSDYDLYGLWLKQHDFETLKLYFGMSVTSGYIDYLMSRIKENDTKHHFLVARDRKRWIGVVHIADIPNGGAEFGFIVDPEYRQQGIADRLMDEATTWCQNRGYTRLFLHCLSWNEPIKKLCLKHGLEVHKEDGDAEVNIQLPPPSFYTIGKEITSVNRNLFTMLLNRTLPL
jgi:RimJ/RimL family protein N-acetyltransferase